MESLRIYDIDDFVDDGINESIYTILTKYHPFMKKDFSLAIAKIQGNAYVQTLNKYFEMEKYYLTRKGEEENAI